MRVEGVAPLDGDGATQVILTAQGRRLLAERAQLLQAALDDRERHGRVDAEDERTITELGRLRWLVDHALILEDLPDEPAVVELGKAVTVQDGQGVAEQYLIVHPVEAPLDDTRISVRSPLAQALLGHRIGEEVEVAAPAGPTAAGSSLPSACPSTRTRRRGSPTRLGEQVPTPMVVVNEAQPPAPVASPPVVAWGGSLPERHVTVRQAARMADAQRPTPSSQSAVDSWVALGAGLGVAIGAALGNVLFWIIIGAVAGLALGSPEDDRGKRPPSVSGFAYLATPRTWSGNRSGGRRWRGATAVPWTVRRQRGWEEARP